MSSAAGSDEIAFDARWLVQALDPAAGVVRLIAMDREAYRGASFLDDRMLQQPVDARIMPWAEVAGAVPGDARRDARWIFHIGHVGSTLLARLLGELPGVLSVREPRFLRDVATVDAPLRAPFTLGAQALFSRTFDSTETALVKATSFVSEIAPELVPAGERALLMYARPEAYVASILAGANSREELGMLAHSRSARMASRVKGLARPSNPAEQAAAAWACEMTSLEVAADAMSDRKIAWMDFDHALGAMGQELTRAAVHFGFDAQADELKALAQGPLMHRYSKALEHDYSPSLRRDLIDDATRRHKGDIDAALAKLERAAENSPLLARALGRTQSES